MSLQVRFPIVPRALQIEPKKQKQRSSIQQLCLQFTCRAFACIPISLVPFFGGLLGGFVYHVCRFRRQVVRNRIACAFPHWSKEDQKKLARHSYSFLGTSLLLLLYTNGSEAMRNFDDLIEIDNESYWNTFATSKSVILTTGHIGLWELLPKCFSHHSLPHINQRVIVYRPLHNSTTEALVKFLRQKISQNDGGMTQFLPDKKCFSFLQRTLEDKTTSSIIGLLSDQRCHPGSLAARVQFLQKTTLFPTGAARLHLATQTPLWFGTLVMKNPHEIQRNKPFKLILRPLTAVDEETCPQQSVELLTQEYAKILEEIIVDYPEQYLWMHNLWRTKEDN